MSRQKQPSCSKYRWVGEPTCATFTDTPTPRYFSTIFNEPFTKGGKDFPAVQEDFEFAKKFSGITEKLLAEGKLKTHPEQVGAEGLAGALRGLEDMKNDKVSGKKLVYRVADTPSDSKAEAKL